MSTAVHCTKTVPLNTEQRSLVEDNLGLVHRIASRWRSRCRSSLNHADLLQVGALALTEAALRYDPTRQVSFAGMAGQRIRGAIQDHLRSLDPLSRRQRSSLRELQSATAGLANRLGRRPEVEELSDELDWEVDRVQDVSWLSASLAQGWAQTQELPDAELAQAPGSSTSAADPQQDLLRSELEDELHLALQALPERERLVLDLYVRQEMKLTEIGEILGVTESRVSQLRSAALTRLRRRLTARLATPGKLSNSS